MKRTFVIKPGIASVVRVHEVEGEYYPQDVVYLGPDPLPRIHKAEDIQLSITSSWHFLPLAVRAAVKKHFAAVFSTPLHMRQEYLDSLPAGGIVIVMDAPVTVSTP